MLNTLEAIKRQIKGINSRRKCYAICQEFIKTTNFERKQNAEVLTPLSLVNEMLSKIPSSAWTDMSSGELPKIFDPCVGKGAFVVAVYDLLWGKLKKLIPDEEERRVTILEHMIYFADINPRNTLITKAILDPSGEYKLNTFVGDTLQLDTEEWFGVKKFDLVVGNPPYSTDPSWRGNRPLYNLFIERYILHDKLTFVVPKRWFAGGKNLDEFRRNMLSMKDIRCMTTQEDATKWFGKIVQIQGGVMHFLKDSSYFGKCKIDGKLADLGKYDIIPDSKYIPLIERFKDVASISRLYMSSTFYGVTTNDKRFRTEGKTRCIVSKLKTKDRTRFVDMDIPEKKRVWKVITANASATCNSGFGFMNISPPEEIYSGTYIGFKVSSKAQAESLLSYMKTKFANTMLKSRKISQQISKKVVEWIPLVPLDRIWSDESVCKYFGLKPSALDV